MRGKPSCFSCVHAHITEDRSVGIPAGLDDCRKADESEYVTRILEGDEPIDEVEMAENCGCFTPKMVDKCWKCEKEINQPEYLWNSWYWDMPLCKECFNYLIGSGRGGD